MGALTLVAPKDTSILGLLTFTLTAAFGALFTFFFIKSIYRLYFHPLAKYPGPFLARISNVHQTWHAYHGDRHINLYQQHEKYGKIIRYGPNALSINSASALATIYGAHANVQKSVFYTAFAATPQAASTHSTIDKVAHARKRRVLSHAFSEAAVKSMEKYILHNVRAFTDGLMTDRWNKTSTSTNPALMWEKREKAVGGWGPAQNMADWCNYLTFDIMGDLCFGKAFNMLEKPDNHFAADMIGMAAHRHSICGTMPLLHNYHLDTLLFPTLAAGRARYMQYSKGQAAARAAVQDPDRRDFFHYLLSATDPETGAKFSMSELWGESNLLIIAGSDTTSTALASAFFYLVHNAEKLDKAVREVRSVFAHVEEIVKGQKLGELVYLRAVLDEGMRLSPPVGGILPREVLRGGIAVDGVALPAGIDVGVSHHALHKNPLYYPSPFAFVPERWLVGQEAGIRLPSGGTVTSREDVAVARSAFAPFSVGPRACIGRNLAYAELLLALARVLWVYDVRLAPGTHVGEGGWGVLGRERGRERVGEYQLRDSFTSLKDGPMVEFRVRV